MQQVVPLKRPPGCRPHVRVLGCFAFPLGAHRESDADLRQRLYGKRHPREQQRVRSMPMDKEAGHEHLRTMLRSKHAQPRCITPFFGIVLLSLCQSASMNTECCCSKTGASLRKKPRCWPVLWHGVCLQRHGTQLSILNKLYWFKNPPEFSASRHNSSLVLVLVCCFCLKSWPSPEHGWRWAGWAMNKNYGESTGN